MLKRSNTSHGLFAMQARFRSSIMKYTPTAAAGLTAFVIAVGGFSGHALAQYTGPSSVPVMTVQQLQETGKDDQKVILRGRIVSHDGGDRYTFADDSGQMRVDISKRRLPQGQAFNEQTPVELVGEYDKDFRSAEVDVDEVRLVR